MTPEAVLLQDGVSLSRDVLRKLRIRARLQGKEREQVENAGAQ